MSIDFYNQSGENRIFDVDFVDDNEGGIRLYPYYSSDSLNYYKIGSKTQYIANKINTIPSAIFTSNIPTYLKQGMNSGITIAAGFDFAQKPKEVLNLISDVTARDFFSRVIGSYKNRNILMELYVNQGTAHISSNDAKRLMNWWYSKSYSKLSSSIKDFNKLPLQARTVAFDIANNGLGHKYLLGAIPYFNSQDWSGLISYVNARSYINKGRRLKISQLLSQIKGESKPTIDDVKNPSVSDTKPSVVNVEINTSYLAICNELVLSQYNNDNTSVNYFTNILKKANISDDKILVIIQGLGVIHEKANKLVDAYKNFNLTEEETNAILTQLLTINKSRVESNLSMEYKKHPIEVNTALTSYFMDLSIVEGSIKSEINPILELLKAKKYNAIADIIEKSGEGKLNRLKVRRTNEAELIRNRSSDLPNYKTTTSQIDGNTFFNGKEEGLNADARNAEANLRALQRSKSTRPNDDITTSITTDVSESYSDLLQKHQTLTDGYYNSDEKDYDYRLRVKNTFNTVTRNTNKTYVQYERQVSDGNNPIKLDDAYERVPMGSKLYVDVKQNAVSRCKYRIKKLKYAIEQLDGEFAEYGIFNPSMSIGDLVIMSYTNPAIAVAMVVIKTKMSEYVTYTSQLEYEEQYLTKLIIDLNHFNP